MASLNKVFILGNLGKDPILREVGTSYVCNFPVATAEKYQKDDVWVEKVEWHNIIVWGKSAENCAKYLRKGSQVHVEGKIQTEKYQKDGADHWSTKIVAISVQFIGAKGDDQEGGGKKQKPEKEKGSSLNDIARNTYDDDMGFPF